MPETIVIEEIITRLYHDLEKYGVRFRNIFRVCSLSFVYENINWVKWDASLHKNIHARAVDMVQAGRSSWEALCTFTIFPCLLITLKMLPQIIKKSTLIHQSVTGHYFFLQKQQNHSKACPGIQRNWKCLRPTLKAKTSCNDTSKGPLN